MQGECASAVEDDVCEILRNLFVMRDSPHPRRGWERAVEAIGKRLKRQPTVPSKVGGGHWTEEELDKGVFLPKQHCPFGECTWRGQAAEEILDHVAEAHYTREVEEAVRALGVVAFKAALYTVLNAAVSWSCKQEAPVVSVAQDRRALRVFQESVTHADLQALVCFCCGCVHPHLPGEARQKIRWKPAGKPVPGKEHVLETFLGLTLEQVEDFFGLQTFLNRHGSCGPGFPNLQEAVWQTELKDWQCSVPFEMGDVRTLCNPEDRRCRVEHVADICWQCEVPICFSCQKALQRSRPEMPVRALSNNLWTGFAAPMLAVEDVSYLEAVLASPCMLSLVCFSLEVKHGNVMLEKAQHQRARVGARGNITLFPLPLQDVFRELHRQARQGPQLPWVGSDIADAVRIVLRTSELTDARVIVQARVRRNIVVRLIQEAVARGHPAYSNVRMEDAMQRAVELPEDGVLEELVALARQSQSEMENLQAAKHGTPPLGEREKARAFEALRPSAVTCTRNAYEEVCAGEVDGRAWQDVAAAVRGEEMHIFTGSEMIDQFTSDFFARREPGAVRNKCGSLVWFRGKWECFR